MSIERSRVFVFCDDRPLNSHCWIFSQLEIVIPLTDLLAEQFGVNYCSIYFWKLLFMSILRGNRFGFVPSTPALRMLSMNGPEVYLSTSPLVRSLVKIAAD